MFNSTTTPAFPNTYTLRVENGLIKGDWGFLSVTDLSSSGAGTTLMTPFGFDWYFKFFPTCMVFLEFYTCPLELCSSYKHIPLGKKKQTKTPYNPKTHLKKPCFFFHFDQHSCSFQKSLLTFFSWKDENLCFLGFLGFYEVNKNKIIWNFMISVIFPVTALSCSL